MPSAAAPRNAPDLGDVYRADPRTSVNGDVHGDHKRPVVVVELRSRVAMTLTRTTQRPSKGVRSVRSRVSPSLQLTKPGWWTDLNQRPLSRRQLAKPELCAYLGRLCDPERGEVLRFWDITKSLGKEGL